MDEEQGKKNIANIEKKLTNEEQKELNSFFKEEEIKRALKAMKNGKTPGEDGIPKEFYLHFCHEIHVELMEMINNIALRGELAPSQRNAIIRLLYKKGDHRMLKN